MGDGFVDRDHLQAGELARQAMVSTDTLRHYERKGVLPRPRRGANGYRMYPKGSLERVQLVRRALAVGFTLDELARILRERDSGRTPCKEVYALAERKLSDTEEQLTTLVGLRDELRQTLADWKKVLSKAVPGTQSKLLESLNGKRSRSAKPFLNLKKKRK
ncbi:MAG: heavy metal-responsive transcriptional regulator [Pyrinomonadaceae bacterium]